MRIPTKPVKKLQSIKRLRLMKSKEFQWDKPKITRDLTDDEHVYPHIQKQ